MTINKNPVVAVNLCLSPPTFATRAEALALAAALVAKSPGTLSIDSYEHANGEVIALTEEDNHHPHGPIAFTIDYLSKTEWVIHVTHAHGTHSENYGTSPARMVQGLLDHLRVYSIGNWAAVNLVTGEVV